MQNQHVAGGSTNASKKSSNKIKQKVYNVEEVDLKEIDVITKEHVKQDNTLQMNYEQNYLCNGRRNRRGYHMWQ